MEKPAILLITGDEWRKDSLGCYGGNIIKTPNLDALALEAIKFDRAYCTSPTCLPSRCSILTGLMPSQNGAYSNFREKTLDPKDANLFNVLKSAGYRTAVSGKCHFAPVPYGRAKPDITLPYDSFRDYYISLGIDDLFLQDSKQVSVWFYDDYSKDIPSDVLDAYRKCVWDKSLQKVFPFPCEAKYHPDAWVGRKMKEYIDGYDRKEPPFLWLSLAGPHYPFDAPEQYYDRIDYDELEKSKMHFSEEEFSSPYHIHNSSYHGGGGIDGCDSAPSRACKNFTEDYWHKLRRNYFANIALMDDVIGDTINAAKKKWGDNIMIIVTADHGEMLGNHGLWGKHDCAYEDVWNVPLIVKRAGKHKGEVSDSLVMLSDIFQTCINAAGVQQFQSRGADLLTEVDKSAHQYIYSEKEGFIAISDGRYKYIHASKPKQDIHALHDIAIDPHEFKNFIFDPNYSQILIRLQQQLISYLKKQLLA